MTEGVLKASRAGFPVAPPKRVIVNAGQYGRSCISNGQIVRVANPLSAEGSVSVNYASISYSSNDGTVVWSFNTQTSPYYARNYSLPYFYTEGGVDYFIIATDAYNSGAGVRLIRWKISDGTHTLGAYFGATTMAGSVMFKTQSGLWLKESEDTKQASYKIDLVNLTISHSGVTYPFYSFKNSGMLSHDEQSWYMGVVLDSNRDNSQSWGNGSIFRAGVNVSGAWQSSLVRMPLQPEIFTTVDGNVDSWERGAASMISDDIVVMVRQSDTAAELGVPLATGPTYFDRVDFDRWLKEMTEITG